MTFSLQTMAIETFVPMLGTLSQLLDKAAAHADAKKIDPSVLVDARLFPDMYPLFKQVQFACVHAEHGTRRLMGQDPPRFEGESETFSELKKRIANTIEYLKSAPASSFEGAEEHVITMPLQDPLVLEMKGHEFLRDWVIPNFYFHLVTAYAILRNSGVELGKRDFMSHIGRSVHPRKLGA